MANNF
jgi:hypothetical protein